MAIDLLPCNYDFQNENLNYKTKRKNLIQYSKRNNFFFYCNEMNNVFKAEVLYMDGDITCHEVIPVESKLNYTEDDFKNCSYISSTICTRHNSSYLSYSEVDYRRSVQFPSFISAIINVLFEADIFKSDGGINSNYINSFKYNDINIVRKMMHQFGSRNMRENSTENMFNMLVFICNVTNGFTTLNPIKYKSLNINFIDHKRIYAQDFSSILVKPTFTEEQKLQLAKPYNPILTPLERK